MILAMSSRPCSTISRYCLPHSHVHLMQDTGEPTGKLQKGMGFPGGPGQHGGKVVDKDRIQSSVACVQTSVAVVPCKLRLHFCFPAAQT